MKPILLEIEGFNSFEKKQEIDFEKLTSQKLFGIFGRTGSGKTSILDAIIYALYAKIPRGADNIVNSECKKASIRYIFSIKGSNAGTYEIQRSVSKSKTDDETILAKADSSKKSKLIKITRDLQEVLADSKKEVDKKIVDIIGLDYDDFIKTVVLPQGEFSSFLKEKNKDRKDMLERLFSLKKYGNELNDKIKNYKAKYDDRKKDYDKELSIYENIDEHSIQKLEKEFENAKQEIEKLEKIQGDMQILQNEVKQLESLKVAYEETEKKLLQIKSWGLKIEDMREKCKNLSKLSQIQDTIKNYEELSQDLPQIKEISAKLNTQLKSLEETKSVLLDEKNKIDLKLQELPQIRQHIQELQSAITVKENIKKLEQEKKSLEEKISLLQKNKIKIQTSLVNDNNKLESINTLIRKDEQQINQNTFSSSYKEQIRKAVTYIENIDNLDNELKTLKQEILNSNEILSEKQKLIASEKNEIENLEKKLQKFSITDEQNIYTIEAYQENENNQKLLETAKAKIDINNRQILKNSEQVLENQERLQELSKDLQTKIEKSENLKHQIEKIKKNDIIKTLKNSLKDGEECPVCRGVYHIHKDDIYDMEFDEIDKDNALNEILDQISSFNSQIAVITSEIEKAENQSKNLQVEIDEEYTKFQNKDIDEEIKKCEEYKIAYKKYTQNVEEQSKIIKDTQQNLSELKISISINETELKNINESIKQKQEQISKKTGVLKQNIEELKNLSNQTQTEKSDFKQRLKQILSGEQLIEQLNQNLQKNKQLYSNIQDKIKISTKNLENINKQIIDIQFIQEKNNSAFNIELTKISDKSIYKLENIEDIIDEKQKYITNIENIAKKITSDIESTQRNLDKLKLEKARIDSEFEIKTKSFEEKKLTLQNFKNNENFASIEEIFKLNEEYPKLKEKQDSIDNYDKQLREAITSREVSYNQYTSQQEKVNILQKDKKYDENEHILIKQELDLSKKNYGYLENQIKNDKIIFKKKKNTFEKKLENDKILAEITEIEKLFKGKTFVQFLAKYQLNYVCKKASEILINISCGRFELSIDDEGEFIISDFQNGGIRRMPTTLSGGETFLVSLSLALALSSQIQLKGNAPLEFFFMDEGFGTLDNETLDVALDCLKKLKSENNLSIGIISHIDKIKEFVPIKLEINQTEYSASSTAKIVVG